MKDSPENKAVANTHHYHRAHESDYEVEESPGLEGTNVVMLT